ncbi:hypothetical protein CEE37_04710 [candidate division LCP-89 bacterium B3_LCP]|uniref:Phosphoribosyltransferase domain-containing protein n=1 Tax=candidate division LCP-89 bacterium B3_LCP TaxID=2012998 RepID=A0A532V3T0_UNCL8|nr:MAG: hypothetical protein CEE37_04710 [candidate division LCP-89 bacterium B3_LCP]
MKVKELKIIYDDLIGILIPDTCIFCSDSLNGSSSYLCDSCWAALPVFPDRSGTPFRALRGVLDRLWIGWDYEERLRRIIHLFKFHGRPEFAELLVDQWISALPHPDKIFCADLLVPVPIHLARQRSRGFNQSELIADVVAQKYGIDEIDDEVLRVINTPPQFALGRSKRWQNLKDAFQVANPAIIRQKRVLIIDDLATSGATLHAIAVKLRENGAGEVSAAVLASPAYGGQAM